MPQMAAFCYSLCEKWRLDQLHIFCSPVLLSPEHRPPAQNREWKERSLGQDGS